VSTFQAIVFILKSIVDLGMYLTKAIDRAQYLKRLAVMDNAIHKATNGELGTRLEGGQQVEDVFNGRVGP
jgi:hypothetical protein